MFYYKLHGDFYKSRLCWPLQPAVVLQAEMIVSNGLSLMPMRGGRRELTQVLSHLDALWQMCVHTYAYACVYMHAHTYTQTHKNEVIKISFSMAKSELLHRNVMEIHSAACFLSLGTNL